MAKVLEKPVDNKEQDLEEFTDLMKEVAELPDELREKVCIFVQGFMAAGDRKATGK